MKSPSPITSTMASSFQPRTLPLPELPELWSYGNSPFSFLQISHRSTAYDELNSRCLRLLRSYFRVPSSHQVILVPSGVEAASIAFNLASMNEGGSAHLSTGPKSAAVWEDAKRICSNSTIQQLSPQHSLRQNGNGLQFKLFQVPQAQQNPNKFYTHLHLYQPETQILLDLQTIQPRQNEIVVLDLTYYSSCLTQDERVGLVDFNKIGIAYVEGGRDLGLIGLSPMFVHKDLIGKHIPETPDMMTFSLFVEKKSIINTPFTLATYVLATQLQEILKPTNQVAQ